MIKRQRSEKGAGGYFPVLMILSILLVIVVSVAAGKNNYGMEGDEVFSYISSTAMGGFKQICFLEDQTWYDASYFENALTATGEERFNIKMVVDNQAMDTHPPLYYLFLNFICSFFEGEFSVWFGIGLNIFFLILAGTGLYLLMQYFLKNRYMSLLLSLIFCCSYLSINMVLFIRMYVLLTALVLFQSWYHLKFYDYVMKSEDEVPYKKHIMQYLVMIMLTVLGGLTHYYFLVYQCLIAFVYVLKLWKNKNTGVFRYAGTMAVSGILYVCLYPAMINHVFLKYRGREAVHKFLKEGTLFGAVISMLSEFDKELFKGWLIPLLILLFFITAVLLVRKRIKGKAVAEGLLLALPCLIYFFGISKASPYVSIRYVSPVAPLFFAVIVVWAKYLIDHAGVGAVRQKFGYAAVVLLLFLSTFYFLQEPIKNSYFAERKEVVDELAQEADFCVYITGDEYNWKMWEDYVNYPEFKGLFFIDGRYMNPITDEKLKNTDKLVIYVDKALDLEKINNYLKTYLAVRNYEIKYETAYTYIIFAN